MLTGTENHPLFRVHNLCAGYGGPPVLHDVSFEIWPGQITALLGPNGAGKTTLMRAICGLVRCSGQVELEGQSLLRVPTAGIARAGVAHVPEGRGTFTDLTVEENLRVGGFARKSRNEMRRTIEQIYGWLPRLAERRFQAAGSLSGGEQQMLAIGRALVAQPKLLLLDEPSFGLAPRVAAEMMRLLRRLQAETPLGILLVEQNAAAALKLADVACVLSRGRITSSGSANEMSDRATLHAAYLGATA